ncbi:MAG: hypothetical protein ACT4P3_01085, partial [Betaproteobacteria bacterium]
AGDCAVARCAAGHVERAYAAGALDALGDARAPNLVPVPSDGVRIAVPEASVDAALSSHLIERLHPRDALEHLQAVRRALLRAAEACLAALPGRMRRRLAGHAAARALLGLHAEAVK